MQEAKKAADYEEQKRKYPAWAAERERRMSNEK